LESAITNYYGYSVTVIDEGVSGSTTFYWTESQNLDRAASHNPDIITIMLGTNDIHGGPWLDSRWSSSTNLQNLRQIIDGLQSRVPNAEIYLLSPIPYLWAYDGWDVCRVSPAPYECPWVPVEKPFFVDNPKQVAIEKGCGFIDIFQLWMDYWDACPYKSVNCGDLYVDSLIHENGNGAMLITIGIMDGFGSEYVSQIRQDESSRYAVLPPPCTGFEP
jgi:lysophospholipase L1-like esterase